MKTTFITFILSIVLIQSMSSQNNNLVIYSPEGLQFTIILNGIRQNQQPETNVKVTDLNAPNYQVKVIFANNSLDLDQNVYLMYGGNQSVNTELTYAIVNVKGRHKLKFKSTAPINGLEAAGNSQQTVVVYTPVTIEETTGATTSANTAGTSVHEETTTVSANGTTTGSTNSTGVSTATTTSTTTTTITSTTTGSNAVSTHDAPYILEGYNGTYGCPSPMNNSDFENAKQSIASKGFEESKLTIAKQIISSNCLLCSQIRELMELMSFEQTKLDLAKFAWHYDLDKGNYYKLNDAFSFESSVTELNQYTQSH